MRFHEALAEIRKSRISKDSPTGGDVHVSGSDWGSNKQPRRRKPLPPAIMAKGAPGLPHEHIGHPGRAHFIRQLITSRQNDANPNASRSMRPPRGWAHKSDSAGLYVHRPLLNAKDLQTWAAGAGIPNVVPPEEMHTTIVYSRAPASMQPEQNAVTVAGGDRAIQQLGDKGALVLIFESPELEQQHDDAQIAGATHDFPGFIPHVTLSYDAKDVDLSKITPPGFPLEFGPEVHAPLNENWAEEKGLRKFELKVPITKMEPDQNRVFGWASIVEKDGQTVVDVQDDTISEADLEEAFYGFVKDARAAGEMHADYGSHIGDCIECMVFTKEKQKIMKIDLGFVGAWIGFEVAPEVFAKVKDGSYPAFSIGGEGIRVRVD